MSNEMNHNVFESTLGGSQQANSGIRCDVKNCHYHGANDSCTAQEIKVGPQYASSSADTVCVTFRPSSKQ